MTFNPEIHHRHSIRLPNYDYSQPGYYFVTLCTHERECIFGDIKNDKIVLNNVGTMVEKKWHDLPDHFPGIELDQVVIMPNHVHGIIKIMDDRWDGVSPTLSLATTKIGVDQGAMIAPFGGQTNQIRQGRRMIYSAAPLRNKKTLGQMVAWFKYESTKEINRNVSGNPNVKIWQRNFFDRIIRNDEELNRIRNYIITNPETWGQDENNV